MCKHVRPYAQGNVDVPLGHNEKAPRRCRAGLKNHLKAGQSDSGNFREFFLDLQRLRRQLVILGLCQERIKPTAMVNGAQCVGRDFQLERLAKRIRN